MTTSNPRKRKPPPLHDGLHGFDGRGRFLRVRQIGGEFWIDWDLLEGGGTRSRRFLDLCRLADLEAERHELGTLAADILDGLAKEALHAIPDPNAATAKSNAYRRLESSWRHWASVPAGHMSGLPKEA
jgi:hypothetical protein